MEYIVPCKLKLWQFNYIVMINNICGDKCFKVRGIFVILCLNCHFVVNLKNEQNPIQAGQLLL